MALPRFLDRVTHAVISASGPVDCTAISSHLEGKAVRVVVPDWVSRTAGQTEGFETVCNLLARSYPIIVIEGSDTVRKVALETIQAINPNCELPNDAPTAATLTWGTGPVSDSQVCISAASWNVYVDDLVPATPSPCSPLAAMAAACLGASEIFRIVLGDLTGDRRTEGTPIGWNLITLQAPTSDVPGEAGVDLGDLTLVGCGAIGQAFVMALRAANCRGRLEAVDPEEIDLSNLQRYVLTTNGDVAERKVSLVTRALANTRIEVVERHRAWSLEGQVSPGVLVCALDTVNDRIRCQGSLPKVVYNAYTSDMDLGWTRHEHFGQDACLACLYWPHDRSASWTEQVARGLGMDDSARRIALYSVSGTSIGEPLAPAILQKNGVVGQLAELWASTSLLADLNAAYELPGEIMDEWSAADIETLYRDGLCGGRLIDIIGEKSHELLAVPLAHESVLAGVMLASSVIAAVDPALRAWRHQDHKGAIQLRGRPSRPYTSSPARVHDCICADSTFREHHHALWVAPPES